MPNDIFNPNKREKALLVAVQLPKVPMHEVEASLAELARLVTTLGYDVIGQTSQKRSSDNKALVLGEGKLKEVADWTGGTGEVGPLVVRKKNRAVLRKEKEEREAKEKAEAEEWERAYLAGENVASSDDESEFDEETLKEIAQAEELNSDNQTSEKAEVVIFDTELSPSQLRNLEAALGVDVLDRTGVIIEIFSRHARTRTAKLQVEIARLTYVAPRLREKLAGNEDRGGGGVGAKGAGETDLELDRRAIRDRIKELRQEFVTIAKEHDIRRARRDQEISVALVGYTNAGKSSLMRALTGSDVLVADKLFATLDTTVRLLYPESLPRILISDTVGFIKKLPHDLVASFKSTLDEALNASLLLYVVDSADPEFRSQLATTKSVLAEVGASEIPSKIVFNKIDRLPIDELLRLRSEFPDGIFMSALSTDDVASLRSRLIETFEEGMVEDEIHIPFNVQGAVGELRERTKVLNENYDERGVVFKVRGDADFIAKLKNKIQAQIDKMEWER